MKERPILFSAPMVRALLDGSKTQTRRVVTAKHIGLPPGMSPSVLLDEFEGPIVGFSCPYGEAGDRLWVREAFMHTPAKYEPMMSMTVPLVRAETSYRADFDGDSTGLGWKPSIHMPRNLSRITLEVISVRVERLHEISASDCWAEGIPHSPDVDPMHEYRDLWESINGHGSWGKNPWVWVVEFRKVTP